VSLVRYELGSYIREDGILHSHRRENVNLTNDGNITDTLPLNAYRKQWRPASSVQRPATGEFGLFSAGKAHVLPSHFTHGLKTDISLNNDFQT
jgi:hypothetical protein